MINQRIFSANVGDISTGQAGPDAIEQDIDNLLANDQELLGTLNDHGTQINSLDADKANKAQGNWITATLQNGWTGTLRYRKNEVGQIEVEGNLVAGTVTIWTTIATLPYKATKNISVRAVKASSTILDTFLFNVNGSLQINGTSANLSTGNTDIQIQFIGVVTN